MGRKRTWTDDQLIKVFNESLSIREILIKLGLAISGGSHVSIKMHMIRLGLEFSSSENERKQIMHRYKIQYMDEDVFTVNESISKETVRKRYNEIRVNSYYCDVCGIDNQWNGHKLTLHTDHINGIRHDHRLCNLRLVCPNCHSQTDTYSGRNK
jgi:hypothetical protein